MNETQTRQNDSVARPWWRNRKRIAFILFIVIAGYFIWIEHRAHIAPYLAWVLLGACLLLHGFKHVGQSHGGHNADDPESTVKR